MVVFDAFFDGCFSLKGDKQSYDLTYAYPYNGQPYRYLEPDNHGTHVAGTMVRSTLETGLKTTLVDLSTPAAALQASMANLQTPEQERQQVLAQAATVQPDAPTQGPAR